MDILKKYENFEPEEEWEEDDHDDNFSTGNIYKVKPKDWRYFIKYLKDNGVNLWNAGNALYNFNPTSVGKFYHILILKNNRIFCLIKPIRTGQSSIKIGIETYELKNMINFENINESFEPEEEWEEDNIELPILFEKFLEQHNCYDNYIKNATSQEAIRHRDNRYYNKDLSLFYKEHNKIFWIIGAFSWVSSPEGYSYWKKIDTKWLSFIKLNESFEPEMEWEEDLEIEPNKIYHIKTQEGREELLKALIDNGYMWKTNTQIYNINNYSYIFTYENPKKYITHSNDKEFVSQIGKEIIEV